MDNIRQESTQWYFDLDAKARLEITNKYFGETTYVDSEMIQEIWLRESDGGKHLTRIRGLDIDYKQINKEQYYHAVILFIGIIGLGFILYNLIK